MESPREHRTSALWTIVNVIHKILNNRKVQCFLVLHFLCWAAESTTSLVLTILSLATIVFFRGIGQIPVLVYQAAKCFSFLVRLIQGLTRIVFVLALYELILEFVGYHSEDYKKFKRHVQRLFTEFTARSCSWVQNMTSEDGTVVLEINDVVGLCSMTWYSWYMIMVGTGLYMAMPHWSKVKKHHFWINVYLGVMMLVVWKGVESLAWYSWWNSVEYRRSTCLFVHYLRYGEDGFQAASFQEKRRQAVRKFT